ncbi:MAG TPA: sugar porter family MFS transporter [Steroidobacteraceae bacterium]
MTIPSEINFRYVLFWAATAATGGLLFGFDVAIISGAGPFLVQQFRLNDLTMGVAFSSLLFGCVIGCAVAGRITDKIGRKRVLLVVAALFAVTSAATGLAWNFSSFLAARFLGGLAVGAVSLVSPMYVSEISPPAVRGRMGALYQMSIVTGILVSFCINYLLRDIGDDNWRWMFITGVVPSAIFLVLLLRAPETPRFLALLGRREEAFAIMERIGGRTSAEQTMNDIATSLRVPRRDWRDLLRPGIRRAVTVGFWLAILIHFSGINTVIDYAPTIFRSAGWQLDAALLSTFVVGLTNFLFTAVSFWTIDRFGRRPLYIAGSLGMALSLLALTVAVLMGQFHGPLVLALILAYLICFCSCIGPVFWTLVPEIFPNNIRGTAMIVPVLTQWVANAVVVLLFPAALHRLGQAPTFGFLAAVSLAQAIFTWRYVPETKNRPLEEIEQFWIAPRSKGNVGWQRA